MKNPPTDAEFEKALAQLSWVQIALTLLFIAIIRGCVVRRTGHSFWLGILWAIPIIGWFFKIWLAHTNWPGVKSATKKAASRKRAAA